jgi:hypothetical protein
MLSTESMHFLLLFFGFFTLVLERRSRMLRNHHDVKCLLGALSWNPIWYHSEFMLIPDQAGMP